MFLSIPGGVLADRVSKQKLQLTMQTASVVLTVALAWFVFAETVLWTLFAAQLGIGIANALNAPAFQSSMPLLVHRQDLPGRHQPQLGDDQRHPRGRPDPRRNPGHRRPDRLADLPRQRGDLPVLHRRAADRADARRPQREHGEGLAQPAHGRQHRQAPRGAQAAAHRDVPVLAVQPRLHRAVPLGRPTEPRHLTGEHHLPMAVRGVGRGRVLRCDLGRHVPVAGRPQGADRARLHRLRYRARRVLAAPRIRRSRSRSGSSSGSSTS